MKSRQFVKAPFGKAALGASLAVLALPALAFSAVDARATRVVPIQGKYSTLKLERICAKEGGSFYGAADTAYGCTKGGNAVECSKDGTCKGYVGREAAGGGEIAGTPATVLQLTPPSPIHSAKGSMSDGGAAGAAAAAQ